MGSKELACIVPSQPFGEVVVWESEPEVPVSAMLLALVAAVAAAVRLMLCGVPELTVMDTGAAVIPAGRPESTAATEAVKSLIAVVVTVTC
jgi:hypothetical protein